MKDSIKIGQSFDVVEVLTDGGYSKGVLKKGGFTIDFGFGWIMANGVNYKGMWTDGDTLFHGQSYAVMYDNEIKRIGKLTITKVK